MFQIVWGNLVWFLFTPARTRPLQPTVKPGPKLAGEQVSYIIKLERQLTKNESLTLPASALVRPKHQPLEARGPHASVNVSNSGDYIFAAKFYVGSALQELELLIDTGSDKIVI